MKARVFWASSLVLWFLIFSTFFSLRVEELMLPQVTVVSPKVIYGDPMAHLARDCIFYTESGTQLFTTYEGIMWERGVRAAAVDPSDYMLTEDEILTQRSSDAIQYASRTPGAGEPVEIVRSLERADDIWLAVAKDGQLPELGELGQRIAILESRENTLLLEVAGVERPFMEKRAQSLVPAQSFEQAEGGLDFYSLTDLEEWMAQMPKIGLLLGFVLAAVVLWGFSGALVRGSRRNRRALIVNSALGALMLAALPVLLGSIRLPASLLPESHIVDFGHYAAEFGEMLGALEIFASGGNELAAKALSAAHGGFIGCVGIAVGAAVAAALAGAFQVLAWRRKGRE